MESVIDLLGEKNTFLEKFYHLNENEIVYFLEGNFENLDNFYNSREKMLGILSRIDFLIEKQTSVEYNEGSWTDVQRRQIIRALDKKSDWVTRILAQDLQILSMIETAKSGIIKELSQLQVARKAIGSYKSGRDKRRVDEKA